MKRKTLAFDFALFALIICAGTALIIFQGASGEIDATPALPGLASGDIELPQIIAHANRKIVEQVEINAQNIQNVIKTLTRPVSYSTEGNAVFYSMGRVLGAFHIKSWVRPDMSKTELYSQVGAQQKLLKNTVLSATQAYVWENAADTLFIGSAGDFSADDLGHMPTYEQILGYSPENILHGGLTDNQDMIVAETKNPQTGFTEKWQIDIESGLLIVYQCYENDSLVSELRLGVWSLGEVDDSVFSLPNGQKPE